MAPPLAGLFLLSLLPSCFTSPSRFLAEGEALPVEVRFDGVQSIARSVLLSSVSDLMVALSREPEREELAEEAATALANLYLAQGYPDSEVHFNLERRDEEGLLVRFQVKEGARVTVDSWEITGNENLDKDEILDLWPWRREGLLGLGPILFVRSEVDSFVKKLQSYYREGLGFLEARVTLDRVERSKGIAKIFLSIEEGPQFRIRRILVTEEILKALAGSLPPSPEGKPVTARRAYDFRNLVRRELRDLGYHDPRLVIQRRPHRKGEKEVDLVLRGDPGKIVRIGDILVEGNETIPESVIRSKFDARPGELFSGLVEREALTRLIRTRQFKRVEIEHLLRDEDIVDILIRVDELGVRPFEPLFGFRAYEKAMGGLLYENRNLFDSGLGIRLKGSLHKKGWDGKGSFLAPRLLGIGMEAGLDFEAWNRARPSFTDKALGGGLSLSGNLGGNLQGRFAYRFRERQGSRIDAVDPAALLEDYATGTLSFELDHDRRDDPLFPRKGSRVLLHLDWTDDAFGGELDFVRGRLKASWFQPISSMAWLSLELETGVLYSGEGSSRIPLQERFYLGGQTSLRSFRESRSGPEDPNGDPVGGEYRTLLRAELRRALIDPFEGAIFLDTGKVGRRVEAYGLVDPDWAIGLSLLVATPLTLLRLDMAFNPDREKGEEEWNLQFRMGYDF